MFGSILPRSPLKDVPSSRCSAHSGPLINVAVTTSHQSSFRIKACCHRRLESSGASWNLIGGHWLEEGRVSCYSWRSWNSAEFQVPWGSPGWSCSAGHVNSEVWTQDVLLDPPHGPGWKEPWGTECATETHPPEADLSLLLCSSASPWCLKGTECCTGISLWLQRGFNIWMTGSLG